MSKKTKLAKSGRDLTASEESALAEVTLMLRKLARTILCNYPSVSVDCEDIVQEVLLETIRILQRGDGIANLMGYLRVAVANRSIARARMLNRSRGVLFQLDDGYTGYLIADKPDERVDALYEKRDRYLKARQLLDCRDQAVLDLLYEGFPPCVIGNLLGLTQGHVYVLTHRLRRKLGHLMSDKKAAIQESR